MPYSSRRTTHAVLALLLAVTVLAACGSDDDGDGATTGSGSGETLVVYSGRNENLVRPVLDRFTDETGIKIDVRYGDTSELLPTIIEEGDNTRADVFLSQDAGALGELSLKGMLRPLPDDLLALVDPRFQDTDKRWVGVTGRVRVIVYNTDKVKPEDVPTSVLQVTDPKWKDRVAIAPTNASFVAYVTSLRETIGEDAARSFLQGLEDNGAKRYDNNVLAIDAVAAGEADLGLVNHYYLYNEFKEKPDAHVANFYTGQGDGGEGSFVNTACVGVLANTDKVAAAERFVRYLLDTNAQEFFRDETAEYPLRLGMDPIPELPKLADLKTVDLPLSQLGRDLEGTVALLKEVGLT